CGEVSAKLKAELTELAPTGERAEEIRRLLAHPVAARDIALQLRDQFEQVRLDATLQVKMGRDPERAAAAARGKQWKQSELAAVLQSAKGEANKTGNALACASAVIAADPSVLAAAPMAALSWLIHIIGSSDDRSAPIPEVMRQLAQRSMDADDARGGMDI